MHALGHDRIEPFDKVTDIAPGAAFQDGLPKTIPRKTDCKESDRHTEKSSLGESGDCPHLTVEFFEFDAIDQPGKHTKKDPDHEPTPHIDQKHRQESIEGFLAAEVRSQIVAKPESNEITHNQRGK